MKCSVSLFQPINNETLVFSINFHGPIAVKCHEVAKYHSRSILKNPQANNCDFVAAIDKNGPVGLRSVASENIMQISTRLIAGLRFTKGRISSTHFNGRIPANYELNIDLNGHIL